MRIRQVSGVIFGATPPEICVTCAVDAPRTGCVKLFTYVSISPVSAIACSTALQPSCGYAPWLVFPCASISSHRQPFCATPSLHPVGSPIRSVPIDVSGTSFKISLAPMPPFSSSQVPRKWIVRGTGRPDFLYSQSAYTIAASPLFISLAPRA